MRNIFDQYSQQENRLTHALATALHEDARLCRGFVKWVSGSSLPGSLKIVEQQIVGESEPSELEADRRGLPDAWIHNDESWALLIESKVSAPLRVPQLRRHLATAQSCGFEEVLVLALTVEPVSKLLPEFVLNKTWAECYVWLTKQQKHSEWAQRVLRYFGVLDAQWSTDGYLKAGTLTMFTGIPFGADKPYNYREAKLYLKQAMAELREQKVLSKKLGADLQAQGRSAITGKQGFTVWDYIPLKVAKGANAFTDYPHLTLFIHRDHLGTIISIPNGLKASLRRKLIDLGEEGFNDLMGNVNQLLVRALKRSKSGVPMVTVQQRHYPSQRSVPIVDAKLEFDLRTAFPSKRRSPVKHQSEWLTTTYDTLSNKNSNLHVSVGAFVPYAEGAGLDNADVIDLIVDIWLACEPLIRTIVVKPGRQTIK